ncbi:MAG: response regulator [SAR202 cluster bacterium]|nr:response regulator [SAR202 cluster bacterium]
MKMPLVLVVDDQLSARVTMRGLIEYLGAQVQTAEDGYQAIEGAKNSPFDLAFIDIEMPGINGVQTLRELLKLQPGLVVAMVTGYGEAGLVTEALNEGAIAVLLKPLDLQEISHLVGETTGWPQTTPKNCRDALNWPSVDLGKGLLPSSELEVGVAPRKQLFDTDNGHILGSIYGKVLRPY